MFKNLLKNVYIRLLERKALKHIGNTTLLFVVGGKEKRVIVDTLHSVISTKKRCSVNSMGYNHRLGIALSLLNSKAGTSSLFYWLRLLFSQSMKTLSTIHIQEVTSTNQDIDQSILDRYNPHFVVVDSSVSYELKGMCVIQLQNDAAIVNNDERLSVISSDEVEKHTISKLLNGVVITHQISNFGKVYEVPTLVAHYILSKLP